MSQVLDFFREQDARLKDVPDEDLTKFIGESYPEFRQEPDFNAQYFKASGQEAAVKAAVDVPLDAINRVVKGAQFAEAIREAPYQNTIGPADPVPWTTRLLQSIRDSAPVQLFAGPSQQTKDAESILWTDVHGNQVPMYRPLDNKLNQEGIMAGMNKAFPRLTAADIQTGNWKAFLPGVDPETGRSEYSVGEHPIDPLTDEEIKPNTLSQIAAGIERGSAAAGEAVGGYGWRMPPGMQGGGLIGRGVNMAFAVQMGMHFPDMVKQFNEARKSGDVGNAVEALINGGVTAYFTAKSAHGALGKQAVPQFDNDGNPLMDPTTGKQKVNYTGVAEESPWLKNLLSEQLTTQYTPDQLKDIFLRAQRKAAGEPVDISPDELEIARFITSQAEPRQAIRRGATVSESYPKIQSEFWRNYLGLKAGEKTLTLGPELEPTTETAQQQPASKPIVEKPNVRTGNRGGLLGMPEGMQATPPEEPPAPPEEPPPEEPQPPTPPEEPPTPPPAPPAPKERGAGDLEGMTESELDALINEAQGGTTPPAPAPAPEQSDYPHKEHVDVLNKPDATDHEVAQALLELTHGKGEDYIPSAQNFSRIALGRSFAPHFEQMARAGIYPNAPVIHNDKLWKLHSFDIDQRNTQLRANLEGAAGALKQNVNPRTLEAARNLKDFQAGDVVREFSSSGPGALYRVVEPDKRGMAKLENAETGALKTTNAYSNPHYKLASRPTEAAPAPAPKRLRAEDIETAIDEAENMLAGSGVSIDDMAGENSPMQADFIQDVVGLLEEKGFKINDTHRQKIADALDERTSGTPAPAPAPTPPSLKDVGGKVAAGLDESLKGLEEIFGKGKHVGSGPSFDEKTYEKARPHFQSAYDHYKNAGKTLKDFLKYCFERWGNAIAPYLKRFVQDVQNAGKAAGTVGRRISDFVKSELLTGNPVSRAEVQVRGQQLGLTERQADEWAELGSTEAARNIVMQGMDPISTFRALVNLYERMPKNAARTTETKINQQYSTPPPLAYAGSVLADFASGRVLVEPTIGHGMLTIAGAPGAIVAGNELDPERLARVMEYLQTAGFGDAQVVATDATSEAWQTTLKELADKIPIDRMGMNPPFGNKLDEQGNIIKFPIHGAATKAKETTSIDIAIALNTLQHLAKDGKAFVIIGAKTGSPGVMFGSDAARAEAYRTPALLEFFKRFKVLDWFTVGGDLYRKMGAGWPVDMIIIGGKGETDPSAQGGMVRPWVKAPRVLESWNELEGLINEHTAGKTGTGPSGGSGKGGSGGGTGPRKPGVPAPRPEQPTGGSGGGERGGKTGTTGQPGTTPSAPRGEPGPGSAKSPKGTPEQTGGVGETTTTAGPAKPDGVGVKGPVVTEPSGNQPGAGLSESLLVPYEPVSKNVDPHLMVPRNIASAMREATLDLEREVGKPVDDYTAEKMGWTVPVLHQRLSAAQIDALALELRNFGRGSALINTDEGGIGKGRVVAAMIQYIRAQGMIPIFVTAKKGLYSDMAGRDLPAVGEPDFNPFITDNAYYYEDAKGREHKVTRLASQGNELFRQVAKSGTLPAGTHGIFTTYSQLTKDRPENFKETPKAKFKRKNNRGALPDGPMWQMLRAIAPRAFFILDEAHLAAGPDSEINLRFSGLLPQAGGIYYSSATFAKRPDNLGLYAIGTSMRNSGLNNEQLKEVLEKGGVPLQQALSSMLASNGELVRRQHDMAGVNVTFKATAKDTAREVQAADSYTGFIRDLMTLSRQINQATAIMQDDENQVRPEDSQVAIEPITFGSRLFNLSNQYLLALRADAIVHEAKDVIKRGRKPFIALYNTMEGPIKDLQARKLPLTFGGILRREMQKMLTITVNDPQAEGGKREVVLTPKDLPDGGAFFGRVEAQINATDFGDMPISPIDHIKYGLAAAGIKTGELTAREGEVDDTGEEVVLKKREKMERNKVLKAYNNGDTDALIVNGSGSTGLSAHNAPADKAKREFLDQRPRTMVVGQPAPDINEFMQMLWRINRFGQLSKPEYIILATALAAERRFATMLRGKLASLNANTTADAESGMTQAKGFADDIFNEVGDRVVWRVMQANEDLSMLMGIDTTGDEPENAARWATGKFVLLPNTDAQNLWDQIIAEFRDEIEQLNETGQNPLKASAEDLRAKTVSRDELMAGTGNTPFDSPVVAEKCTIVPPNAAPKHADAMALADQNRPRVQTEVRAWLDASRVAEAERIKTLEQRGAKQEAIDKARATMSDLRDKVTEALNMHFGETYGLSLNYDQEVNFMGAVTDIKLKGASVSDFSSPSRQQLIFTTNTYRRKFTVPLSKLEKQAAGTPLTMLTGTVGPEDFDSQAETSTERYIVTGNLLRGFEAARQATSGMETKPRVAIYTRHDGSVNTGIIMPPGWQPGATGGPDSGARRIPVNTWQTFLQNVRNDVPMRSTPISTGHPVEISHGQMTVPATGAGRALWADPRYRNFFVDPPEQRGGNFQGWLRGGDEQLSGLFKFLSDKGVRLIATESEGGSTVSNGGIMKARGIFVKNFPKKGGAVPGNVVVSLGGMQHVRSIEMPELVRMARELTTGGIGLKRMSKAAGMFMAHGSSTRIVIDPRMFKNDVEAAQAMAHEIGHAYDFLDDKTLNRGNLIGHLQALRAHMLRTPLVADLKKELLDLTAYWRPYDPLKDPKSYVQYRQSPEELYADALSVLFNSPGLLQEKAPTFYKAFFNSLDARPKAKASLFAVWELLHQGQLTVLEHRGDEIKAMFGKGDEIFKQKWELRKAAANSWDGWWTQLKQQLLWRWEPLATKLPDLIPLMEEHALTDNINARFVRLMHKNVLKPVEDSGMTQDDLGAMLFLQRVAAGDPDAAKAAGTDPDMSAALGRAGIANPLGHTPTTAKMQLLKMNLDLGLDKMTILREAVRVFHEMVLRVTAEAVNVGAYNRDTFRNVIVPNKDNYAAFGVLDYLEAYVPAGLRRQVGTLKGIANPFTVTMLKVVALQNLIALQRVRNAGRDGLVAHFPNEIERVKVPVIGKSLSGGVIYAEPKAKEGRGLMTVLENGKPVYYQVDPYIAKAFEQADPNHLSKALKILDWTYRKLMYPLQITYSVGFQFFTNPKRDFDRTWKNMPANIKRGYQRMAILREYVRTYKDALARIRGTESGLNEEMLANFAVGIPWETLGGMERDDFFGEVMKRYKLLPENERNRFWDSRVLSPVRAVAEFIKARGAMNEAAAKFAAYSFLRRAGWTPKQTAYHVRNYAGTPNVYKRGLMFRTIRAVLPFYNMFLQGFRSDFQRMKPGSGSGWWFKWAMTDGLSSVIAGLAAAGILGETLRELFGRVSEYDRSTYNIIPLGFKDGGDFGKKTVYLRVPRAEDSRLISGLVYKTTRLAAGDNPGQWGQLLDFGAGQMPTLNPLLTIPANWAVAMAGGNPHDTLRGKEIIPHREYSAGGLNELGPMFHWTLDQSGLNNWISWNPHADTVFEFGFSAIPGLNRMIKISDYGEREDQRADTAGKQSERDALFLKLPKDVQSAVAERDNLAKVKNLPSATDEQKNRYNQLNVWYQHVFSPDWRTTRDAMSKGQDVSGKMQALEQGTAGVKR